MAKPDWGRKHVCLECQAAFYDMRRSPIACPKCGAAHKPVALLKSDGRPPRKNRMPPPVAAVVEPEEAPAAAAEPDVPELDEAEDEGAEAEDEGADDAEVEPVGDDPDR
jgi:uncharacterized protein (TIGR02300 family)